MSSRVISYRGLSILKSKNRINTLRLAAGAAALSILSGAQFGLAGTYTDTSTGGLWGTSGNWTGGVPNASGATADFSTLTLGANNTVHLDSSYTVGTLNFGDVGNTYNWTLDNSGNTGNTLTLAGSTTPTINVTSTQSATIAATVAGTQGFTLAGGGILTLTGNNSYTGVTNVSNGTLVLNTAVANTGLTGIAANPVIELDPTQSSSLTTSGSQVTGLNNLATVSSNYNATSSGAFGTVTLGNINGHTALSFNGSGGLVDAFPATTTPETVFAVIDPTSVTNSGAIVAASNVGGLELRLSGGNLDMLRQGQMGFTASTGTVTTNSPTVVALVYNSSSGAYYIGGAFAGNTSSPSLTGSTTLQIGYQYSYGNNQDFYTGAIGTILIYNSSLGSVAIANTSNALLSEYAAPVTLSTPVINLSSTSSNLAIASGAQSISSLTGVAGSHVYVGGGTLTVGSDGTSTVFAGNVSDTGTGSVGTGGTLIKVGAGTLNISGGVSNTGGVQVNAGTLLLSGTYNSSGTTSVTAGTLSITGIDSDTGSHTLTGGTLSISGTNSTTGPFTLSNNAILSLSGSSNASGAVGIVSGGVGTIALIANANNITGSGANASSSAMGSPSSLSYANNLGTTNIQLRSDTSVTFANSGPTGGTGGYPNQTTINYDVNSVSDTTPQTLTLGSTTAGALGYGTYDTNINVTGGNGYTMAIPIITNANGVYLNLNASTANLSIPGGIVNIGPLSVAGASNTSIGTITGGGALTKTGAGTLLLTSSNSYTGATNIAGGTLAVASTGSFNATSGISIASGAKFDITANPGFTLPSSTVLSGTGTIVGNYNHSAGTLLPATSSTIGTLTVNGNLELGGGTLEFNINGSNNSTGGTTNDLINVTGGLNLSGTSILTLLPVTPTEPSGTTWTLLTYNTSNGLGLSGTGALNLSGAASSVFSIITSVPGAIELKYNSGVVGADLWTGSSSSTWDTTTTNFVPAGSSSPISYSNGDNVTFNDSSSVTTVTISSALTPSSVMVNSNSSNYTFTGSGGIGGSSTLTKLGTSILTINTSDSYTGATNISGGVLVDSVSAGSGIGTGPLVIGPAGTLVIGNGSTGGNPGNGAAAISNSSILDNGTIVYSGSNYNYLPVAVIGTGGINVSSGTLGIGSVNNYSGGVNVIGTGTDLEAYEASSLGTGLVTVDAGGSVDVGYGVFTYTNAFNISGSAIATDGNSDATVFTGPITLNDANAKLSLGGNLTLTNTVTATNNQNLEVVGGGSLILNGNVSLGTGNLESAGVIHFTPPVSTTITINTGGVTNFISPATVVQDGLGTTILDGTNTYTGGTNVSAGTLVLNGPNAFPTSTALTVASGALVTIANHSGSSVTPYVPVISVLSNAGTIDITNNALVILNSSAATFGAVYNSVSSAYNSGAWNGSSGSGIITSTLAANDSRHLTAVGVASGLTGFEGSTVLATDVLVKYTYYGDTNLDGKVDGSDYSQIDNGFLSQGTMNVLSGWQNGDFNYDGYINGSDYTLIDNAYNSQNPAGIADEIATPTAQIAGGGGATSAVPEPATLGLLGIGAVGFLGRRRRK